MAKPLRVLFVEDREKDVELLMLELRRGGYDLVCERVDTPEALASALDRQEWDVILCDYRMPRFSALAALALYKEKKVDLPFIVVSGTVGEEIAVEALRAGAHDFMTKDKVSRLLPAIDRELREAASRAERKKIQEQLLISERMAEEARRRLLSILEATPDFVATADPHGRPLYINRAGRLMLGLGTDEDVSDLVIGDTHAKWAAPIVLQEAIPSAIRDGVWSGETAFLRPDGKEIPVSQVIIAHKDSNGYVEFLSTIARDITERKQAEESLQKLLRAVEQTNNAIIMTDLEGRITYVNPAFENVYGYTEKECLGGNPKFLKSGLHDSAFYRSYWEAMLTEAGFRGELVNRTKDGRLVNVEVSANVVRDLGGETIGFIAVQNDITQRKQAEHALQESEEHYRDLINHSHAWICEHDTEGRLLSVNSVAAGLLGYESSSMVGRNLRDLIAPEFKSGLDGYLDEIRNTGSASGVMTMLRSDGTRRTLEYRNVLQTTTSGERIIQGVAFDVTERFTAERAARASQRRLEYVVSSSPSISYLLKVASPDAALTRVVWISENVERLLGYKPSECIGRGWWPANLHFDDREAVFADVARTFESGHAVREYRFRHADGTYRWVRDEQRLMRDTSGRPTEIVGSWSDVTERLRAEQAVVESEKRYRDIFDASPLPKWMYSVPELRILDVNQAAIDHYGYSREEFLAMTLFDLRPPEDADRLREAIRTVVDRPARWHRGIWKHRKKDGTLIDVDVHIHSVVLGGQNVQLAVMLDVTERLRLEEQFRQTQKLEGIGQLAGGIAHDFNNLLMIVQSYSDLLEMHIADEKAIRRDIAEIRGAAARGAAMTGQLLAFSRKQIVRPQIVEPGRVVADLGKMLRRLIREDIQFEIRDEPGSGSVEIDPGQLEQVLVNLVVNARDAMPKGGRITIDVRRVELDEAYAASHAGVKPGPFVQITVTDSGTGMDALTKSRIFEPFFTTKEVGQGTGLGLATVYGIVKGSGGDVWVYSEPGHGSVFKIYLPRVEGPAAAATAEKPAPPAVSKGTETLLILEDEEVIREMLREYLKGLGYGVLEAGNGDDALRIAREHAGPIHLLLTDVVVPGRSGRNVAEVLLRKNPSLRVIFMSGYTDDAAVVRDVKANEVDFLQKPFGLELLARKIREVLDRSKV